MTANARCYVVCSPEYGTVVPVLDFGQGPMEYGRDVLFAYARNGRRAKALAVRAWRRMRETNWRVANWYGNQENPYVGVTVERAVCEHGNQYRCIECDRELSDSPF